MLAGPGALGRWSQPAADRGAAMMRCRAGWLPLRPAMSPKRGGRPRKRKAFLGGSPLGLLLTAQTAHLEGDDQGQRIAYRAMLEHPETEFLGLRGLFMEAMRRDDSDEADGARGRAHTL